jgi:hypothetical protein
MERQQGSPGAKQVLPNEHFVPRGALVESVHFIVCVAVVHFLLFRTAYPSPGLERSVQLEAPVLSS